GANLSGATLKDTNLSQGDLYGADLSDANLCGADLSNADLRGACFKRATMFKTNFAYADLRPGTMRDAQHKLAKLIVSDDERVRAAHVTATIAATDMSSAYLASSDFQGADVAEVDMSSSNLTGADFSNARMNSIIIS
ncbi:MAG: pentapeptide repeat-containing protein, partial [Planctomycetota bacterium]